MNRKNKKFKEFIFWTSRLYIPILLIIFLPTIVSFLVGGSLTSNEVSNLKSTNFYIRAFYNVIPNNIAKYITIGLIVFIGTLASIRKFKTSDVFNDNQTVYIHDCYKRLWLASKILGYKKLCLIVVSLPMQFEVIMNGTFSEFITQSSTVQYEIFDGKIEVNTLNEKQQNSTILNVFICDTYDISINSIDIRFRRYPILKIYSTLVHTKQRYDNPEIVKIVREEMQKAVDQYDELNLFLSTNCLNSEKIIKGSFAASDRSGFKKITVVQMNENKVYDDAFIIYES